jgi:hypothetical protein
MTQKFQWRPRPLAIVVRQEMLKLQQLEAMKQQRLSQQRANRLVTTGRVMHKGEVSDH